MIYDFNGIIIRWGIFNMKSLKKGVKYIRIAPTKRGDYSYTDYPLEFEGRNEYQIGLKFCLKRRIGKEIKIQHIILPRDFDDENWIEFDKIKDCPKTQLHSLAGKYIKRRKPIILNNVSFGLQNCQNGINSRKDASYMYRPVKLIAATVHHIVIEDGWKEVILDSRYAKPEDWIQVDLSKIDLAQIIGR